MKQNYVYVIIKADTWLLILSFLVLTVVCVVSGSAYGSDLLHTTTTLSQGRSSLAATSVGNKAFFAGGRISFDNSTNVVDVYNADLGEPNDPSAWSIATLSQARSYMVATCVGSIALFAEGYHDVVDIYDANAGEPNDPAAWSTATLSLARGRFAATSLGSYAFFAGGLLSEGGGIGDPSSNFVDIVDIFDANTGVWSTATLSQARCDLCATTVGKYALFAGGFGTSNVVDTYDSSKGEPNNPGAWSTTVLSEGRSRISATSVGGYALFAGGGDGTPGGGLSTVDIYDSGLGEPNDPSAWYTTTLTQARTHLAATSLGSKALFAGGLVGPG